MKDPRRVLWEEGVFLTPQHFQQWDRAHEFGIRQRLRSIRSFGFGFTSLSIDPEALSRGLFQLREASGVFADGTMFDTAVRESVPPAVDFRSRIQSGSEGNALSVHLGVARVDDPRVPVVARDEDSNSTLPFARGELEVFDDLIPNSSHTIQTADMRLVLLFDGPSLQGFEHLKVAEIVLRQGGDYGLVEDFTPSCLSLHAAPQILTRLRRILEVVHARSRDLSEMRFGSRTLNEARHFIRLSILNGALPLIDHLYNNRDSHPQEIYGVLARLAGSLTSLHPDIGVEQLPAYDHGNLGSVFRDLDTLLLHLVEGGSDDRVDSVTMPLPNDERPVCKAKIEDPSMCSTADFLLIVRGDLGRDALSRQFASEVGVSSADGIDRLIELGTPTKGAPLEYMPAPPQQVPFLSGCAYFLIQSVGAEWSRIEEEHTIGLYLPPSLGQLEVSLLMLRRSEGR